MPPFSNFKTTLKRLALFLKWTSSYLHFLWAMKGVFCFMAGSVHQNGLSTLVELYKVWCNIDPGVTYSLREQNLPTYMKWLWLQSKYKQRHDNVVTAVCKIAKGFCVYLLNQWLTGPSGERGQ